MYERQFGLRENPFAAGHQSKYVYPSREHQEALAHLRFGIENREPFVLITGEVGTGKTTALYDALTEWKSRAVVALITNSALTRSELYEEICIRFGIPVSAPTSKPQLIGLLERHLMVVRARGDFAILLIDEAQNLDAGLLEETRLLSNLEAQGQKLLQIFLVGQSELEDKLAQPELRQLRQRIAVHYRLCPLSVDDTERYIHHRITVAGGHALTVFPSDSCAQVHIATHGIPREINTVAAQALLNAFVEDSQSVRPEHVRAIVRDTGFHSVLDRPVAPTEATTSAHTREIRHVPEPAPNSVRGPGTALPHSIEPEGQPMAGVRPAGSTESWQSWMDSLAKIPAEPSGEPIDSAETDAGPTTTPVNAAAPPVREPGAAAASPEMSAEEFYAVEEAAMHAAIGDDEADFGGESENGDPEGEDEFEEDAAPGLARGVNEMPAPLRSEVDTTWIQEQQVEDVLPPALAKLAPEDATMAALFASSQSVAREEAPAPAMRHEAPAPVERQEAPAPAVRHETPAAAARPEVSAPVARAETPAPVARVSAAPAKPMQPAAALPIRLRERLEAAERAEVASGSRATGWLIGAAAVAAVAVGVILLMRFRQPEKPAIIAPPRVATSAPAAAASDPAATALPTNTIPETPSPVTTTNTTPAPQPTTASVPQEPAPTTASAPQKSPPAKASAPRSTEATSAVTIAARTPASGAAAKPAAPKALYGVSVASYLAENRATTELARLKAITRLTGRVMPTKDGDFIVVLGSFPTRPAAEKAAGDLIAGGKVDEARVVSVGKAPAKP